MDVFCSYTLTAEEISVHQYVAGLMMRLHVRYYCELILSQIDLDSMCFVLRECIRIHKYSTHMCVIELAAGR